MYYKFSIFCSDQVNLQGSCIPANSLANGLEQHLLDSIKGGFPQGTPMHVSHDMHRPIGWAESTGLLLSGDVAFQVGFVCSPETESEIDSIRSTQQSYMKWTIEKRCANSRIFFAKTLAPKYIDPQQMVFCDAAVLFRKGIAADLYPELFDEKSKHVDMDGLTNYREILQRFENVHPGVFCDPKRGLLIFAHRFFRRSLSHRNFLNEYFLSRFDSFAEAHPELDCRLRLDPDVIGHADEYKGRIELEFWHGPKFSNDVSKIKSGAAVHKSTDRQRFFEGIDETHFWWKEPECRVNEPGLSKRFRTLEVEELVVEQSFGLAEDTFGCRYVHSEYDLDKASITHFDGAIRAYKGDAYSKRKEMQFNKAGKHSEYTKLFRIDKPIDMKQWKELVNAFYRGNTLISEYFEGGAIPPNENELNAKSMEPSMAETKRPPMLLIAYQAFSPDTHEAHVRLDRHVVYKDQRIPYIEFKDGSSLSQFCMGRIDHQHAPLMAYSDTIFNLPRIVLPTSAADDYLQNLLTEIRVAIKEDALKGIVSDLSVSVSWNWSDLLITVSAAGNCEEVEKLLVNIMESVELGLPPSEWVEKLKQAAHNLGCGLCDVNTAADVVCRNGILNLPHTRDVEAGTLGNLMLPKELAARLEVRE